MVDVLGLDFGVVYSGIMVVGTVRVLVVCAAPISPSGSVVCVGAGECIPTTRVVVDVSVSDVAVDSSHEGMLLLASGNQRSQSTGD